MKNTETDREEVSAFGGGGRKAPNESVSPLVSSCQAAGERERWRRGRGMEMEEKGQREGWRWRERGRERDGDGGRGGWGEREGWRWRERGMGRASSHWVFLLSLLL